MKHQMYRHASDLRPAKWLASLAPLVVGLLVATSVSGQDAAGKPEPALRLRGRAVESLVETTTPEALERFLADHVAPRLIEDRSRTNVLSNLELIRRRCRDAGSVVFEPLGKLGLRIVFQDGARRQPLLLEIEASAPHRISRLELLDAGDVEPVVEVAPMTWDTLESRLEDETQRGFSGTVLAARNGEIILHRGFGFASRDRGIPNTTNTLFAIGSTPIDFTHAAILKLVDLGKLRTSEPITSYFEPVPPDKQGITIDQLMTGRSGLRDFHGIPGVDEDLDLSWIDRDTAVKRILEGELRFKPGSEYAHSHSAWGLLAVIVELVAGQEYQEFLRDQFFKPTGMTRTGLYTHALQFDPDEVAVGYGHSRIPPVNSPAHWGRTSWLVMGSGGMVSTPADLFRWNQALRSGALLSPESTRKFRGGGIAAGGNDRGFLTLFNTDLDTIVIVCANSHEGPRDHTTQVALAAVRVAQGR